MDLFLLELLWKKLLARAAPLGHAGEILLICRPKSPSAIQRLAGVGHVQSVAPVWGFVAYRTEGKKSTGIPTFVKLCVRVAIVLLASAV